jgi:phosphoribosylamine--glycine ligase
MHSPLASSQDHKRIGDGDTGPNTGGMGAYSPAPVVTPEVHARAMREIILPTVRGMAADGIPYTGFLYAGLMIGKDGSVKTVEFNCRLGDPETQPIMMRLKSDLLPLLEHAVTGRLNLVEASWDRRVAVGVVLAAANYPGTPRTGDVISGLPGRTVRTVTSSMPAPAKQDGKVITSGGRVLCVTTLSDNVKTGAETRLRSDCRHSLRWHAISPRHRPPRSSQPMTQPFGRATNRRNGSGSLRTVERQAGWR